MTCPGCNTTDIPETQFVCLPCWRKVPPRLRGEAFDTQRELLSRFIDEAEAKERHEAAIEAIQGRGKSGKPKRIYQGAGK
jgi:hypothetical protein